MLNKIKDNIFFKSAFLLLIGGTLTKLVGFILKIIITRKIGTEGIAIYSLLSPTISLLTVIATFSYPTALSKIISERQTNSKPLFYSTIILSFIINIIVILVTILFAPILSNNLLNESRLYYPIICISLTMPFISISSIIKGYFWGKQNMFPYMLSNFIEQLTRLSLILFFLTKIFYKGLVFSICFLFIVNMIGEVVSQIIMILFMPKKYLNFKNIKIDSKDIKSILNICIPCTSSKIIGSISYFFEPIVLTNVLIFMGYSNEYVIYEYGIINAYALSLLLMPQFFTQNMSTALIPELSKHYSYGNKKMCKKRIKEILLVSCFIGLISTIIISVFPKFFLSTLYHTTEGYDYIKILSPFVILFYVEYPLMSSLQALGKSKEAMKCTITSSIIRLCSIAILSLLKIGIYSYILSIIVNLLVSTYLYYKEVKKVLT